MRLRKDDALLLAVVLAVASPALPLLGNPSNLATLILFVTFMQKAEDRARVRCLYLLLLILGLGCLSTVVGSVRVVGSYSVNPNAFGPFFRVAVCACAMACTDRPVEMQRRLLWLGCAASLFAVTQYFSPAVSAFTSAHYLAPERSSVFTEDFSGESIVRVIGVYENPSSVALVALCLILVSVHSFAAGNLSRRALAFFVVVNLMAGVLSLSKVFFAGLPILFAQLLVLRMGKAAVLLLLAAAAGAWAMHTMDSPLVDVVRYAVESALDPDAALKGRYLADQEQAVSQSWLFGHGIASVQDVVINDSAYLVVGYLIGAFGAAVLALHLAWWLWSGRRHVPVTLILVLAALLLAGIGANSVLGYRVDIMATALAASLCMASQRKNMDRKRATEESSTC